MQWIGFDAIYRRLKNPDHMTPMKLIIGESINYSRLIIQTLESNTTVLHLFTDFTYGILNMVNDYARVLCNGQSCTFISIFLLVCLFLSYEFCLNFYAKFLVRRKDRKLHLFSKHRVI